MSFAGTRLSASLVTVTFEPSGKKTRMTFTEPVAILAGGTDAREQQLMGTEEGLDRLVKIADFDRATKD